jgi:hypothetical protein
MLDLAFMFWISFTAYCGFQANQHPSEPSWRPLVPVPRQGFWIGHFLLANTQLSCAGGSDLPFFLQALEAQY